MNVVFCSKSLRDGELTQIVERLAESGYNGVDIWGTHLDTFLETRGTAPALRALCDGLEFGINTLAPEVDFTGSEDECVNSIIYGKKYIDLADELERPVIRVTTGRIGSAAAGDDARRQCVYALQELCEYAQPRGMCLAVETCPDTLADSVPAVLDLLDRVNFPNLRVALNVWHMFNSGGTAPVDAIEEFAGYLMLIHMRNMDRRHKGPFGTNGRPLAKGDVDYIAVFNKLKDIGYTKPLVVEWMGIDRAHMWDQAEQDLAFINDHLNE